MHKRCNLLHLNQLCTFASQGGTLSKMLKAAHIRYVTRITYIFPQTCRVGFPKVGSIPCWRRPRMNAEAYVLDWRQVSAAKVASLQSRYCWGSLQWSDTSSHAISASYTVLTVTFNLVPRPISSKIEEFLGNSSEKCNFSVSSAVQCSAHAALHTTIQCHVYRHIHVMHTIHQQLHTARMPYAQHKTYTITQPQCLMFHYQYDNMQNISISTTLSAANMDTSGYLSPIVYVCARMYLATLFQFLPQSVNLALHGSEGALLQAVQAIHNGLFGHGCGGLQGFLLPCSCPEGSVQLQECWTQLCRRHTCMERAISYTNSSLLNDQSSESIHTSIWYSRYHLQLWHTSCHGKFSYTWDGEGMCDGEWCSEPVQ